MWFPVKILRGRRPTETLRAGETGTPEATGKAQRTVSVAQRLRMAFGLLVGLIALVGAGAMTARLYGDATVDELTEHVQPTRTANLLLLTDINQVRRSLRGYLLSGDHTQLAEYRKARRAYPALLADARGHSTPGTLPHLATEQRQIDAYLRIASQQEKAVPGSAQAHQFARTTSSSFLRFEATNKALDAHLAGQANDLQERADLNIRSTIIATGIATVALVTAALIVAVRTTRALTRPLGHVQATLAQLAAGEHSARVGESGPSEIRVVAHSVNALADESDRLRTIEAEHERLSAVSRKVGRKIRERLQVGAVLDEVVSGVGEGLRADYAIVLLVEGDKPFVPAVRAWNAERGILTEEDARGLPPVPAEVVRGYYDRGGSWHIDDIRDYLVDARPLPDAPAQFGTEGMPSENRSAAAELNAVAVMVSPFGVGSEAMGALVLIRCRPGDIWRPVEIDAAQSVASGLGRAFQHSRLYEKEARVVEDLRALDRAKSDFLSTVSHELRTPLTSIAGYVELLMDEDAGPLTPEQHHMLSVVDRNSTRLRSLIEDLLTLSRIESGAFTSGRQPVDLCRLMGSTTDAIRPAASAAEVDLETDCPAQPLLVHGDTEQLDRVLMNLLSNAVKFTPKGGRVSVRAAAEDGEAVLSVSDTGIGIPEEEQKDLFTRFFRASNATALAVPGTGLGLTIVRKIVANHGGDLGIRSQEGKGTTVTARIPLHQSDTPE